MRTLVLVSLAVLSACGTGKIEIGDTGTVSGDTGFSGDCPLMEHVHHAGLGDSGWNACLPDPFETSAREVEPRRFYWS